jgi:hypothetical protein
MRGPPCRIAAEPAMAALHVQAGKISNREGQHDLNARFST